MARSKKSSKKGKKSKKSRSISVDMEGVESGGRVADGDYKLTVEEIEIKEGVDSGNEYLNFIFEVEGGGKVYHICSLQPQALFNLRSTLEALEVEVPDSVMDIDLDDLEGLECAGTIANEVYQGKKNPKIVELFTLDELDPDNTPNNDHEEEEEPKKRSKKEKKDKKEKKKKSKKSKRKDSIDIGDDVTFDDDGDEVAGEVTDIENDVVTIKDEDGDEWEVEIDEVSLA